jgi:hypothetical protein
LTAAEFKALKEETRQTIVKMAGDIFEEMIAEDLAAGRVERVPGKEDTYRNVTIRDPDDMQDRVIGSVSIVIPKLSPEGERFFADIDKRDDAEVTE